MDQVIGPGPCTSPCNADLLPVALLEAGVTDGGEDRQVLFELVHLPAEGLCHATGARKRGELLGQFIHSPPHEVQLLTDLLCIQVLERAWDQTERTWISKLNVFSGQAEQLGAG